MSTDTTPSAGTDLPVKSPCVHVCVLDNQDICQGCYRTGLEISHWGRMTNPEKRDVLALCQQREQASGNVFVITPPS
ncbi:DUF1289 domain-containing protein [Oceanobacter sp. 3_MG-2023]|uniref:DUF1289 domain-containing protein n=1 Tax=Oceanobacter sp. 3_MG-2023 TaxID=3062622 RepID=UPI0027334ECB|nr:DUF1289 domain-containing protein [Oceanobacter sp. 3_MG-2023]MDP2504769.1 DUF1289 domain-containing protein [Oceanobacter sp. 3_MG-2023]